MSWTGTGTIVESQAGTAAGQAGLNCYATTAELAARRGMSGATVAELLKFLQAASREIDGWCKRFFYSAAGTRQYIAPVNGAFVIEDLLALSKIEVDEDFDEEPETERAVADARLVPINGWPKTELALKALAAWTWAGKWLRLTGTWGYGDGLGASPWEALAATVSGAAGAATMTASAGTAFAPGMTIMAGAEQIFISAVSENTLSVRRGVNGTATAAHDAAAAAVALYPEPVRLQTLVLAARAWQRRGHEGVASEGVEGYSAVFISSEQEERELLRALSGLRRC